MKKFIFVMLLFGGLVSSLFAIDNLNLKQFDKEGGDAKTIILGDGGMESKSLEVGWGEDYDS